MNYEVGYLKLKQFKCKIKWRLRVINYIEKFHENVPRKQRDEMFFKQE